MSKIRILFLGTPAFAVAALEGLLADDHFDVVGVITQPDKPAGRKMQLTPSPVKDFASRHGLAVFSPPTVNSEEFRNQIRPLAAESAVVVAFGQILGQKFMDLFPQGCVNVHGSLLPRWRGAAPIQRALMNGDQQTGVSLQVMVKALDAGPVLGERVVTVDDQMDAVALHDRLKILGRELLTVEYMDYLRGNLTPHPQNESLVTYAAKISKAETQIDWTRTAVEIFNHIRGLTLGPQAFSTWRGGRLKFYRSCPLKDVAIPTPHSAPGAIWLIDKDRLAVTCGSGTALEILELQPESRARTTTIEFLRGHQLQLGDRFS